MKIHSRTYYSIEQILEKIGNRISGVKKNKIASAYDFADRALEKEILYDTPIFFHSTRICYSLISEFNQFNPDIINSSLIVDVFKSEENISCNVIDINFGPYVAWMYEIFSSQDEFGLIDIQMLLPSFEKTIISFDDFLMIWLAKHLDIFRCINYLSSSEIVEYIFNFSEILNMIPEVSKNHNIMLMIEKIQNERNKLIC